MKTLKNIFPKITLILLLAVALSSCSKKDNPETPVESNYYITAKIDGVEKSIAENQDFTNGVIVIAFSMEYDGIEYYQIQISDKPDPDTEFGYTVRFPKSEGTFSVPGIVPGTTGLAYVGKDPNGNGPDGFNVWSANEFNESPGTITITEINDTYITGTFSFTGVSNDESTINVTEGEFKARNK